MDEFLCSLSGRPLFAAFFRRARAGLKVKGSTDDSELLCTKIAKNEKYLTLQETRETRSLIRETCTLLDARQNAASLTNDMSSPRDDHHTTLHSCASLLVFCLRNYVLK